MNRKIKIVFGLPSFIVGGTERQLLKQLKVYDYDRYDVTLITLFEYKNKDNLYSFLPKRVKIIRFHFDSFFDFKKNFELYKVLKKIEPDIVVSSAFRANTLFRILKIFVGYPIITREHNMYGEKTFFQRAIDHLLSFLSCKIIAISQTVADYTSQKSLIPIKKFKVILSGIECDDIEKIRNKKENLKEKVFNNLNLNKNQKIVLNVGRIQYQKNQELLINGFVKFYKDNPDHVLLILGDGILRPKLEKQIKDLNCEKYVRLLGHRNDVYDFFCVADMFALTSRYEGGPNSVLEALAFGLPVVTTKVSGMDEYIKDGENGFFIDNDCENLEKQFIRISKMNESELLKIKKNAIMTAEKYDIKLVVKKYLDVINDCLSKK